MSCAYGHSLPLLTNSSKMLWARSIAAFSTYCDGPAWDVTVVENATFFPSFLVFEQCRRYIRSLWLV